VHGIDETATPTWVRFNRVSTNVTREVEVGAGGVFELQDGYLGAYVLMVLQPSRVLAAKYVQIGSGKTSPTLEVTVGEGSH
jgi:hypothetical protein